MFEKEAEEYAEKHAFRIPYDGSNKFYDDKDYECSKEGFQRGAEFGYNKANEWHYVKDGKYPKESKNVWCYCKGIGIKFCCVGHTIVGGDNKVRWWASNKFEELRVIAWKEIVLPKESE